MVAASFKGVFSCATAKKGMDIKKVNRIDTVRFMRSAPKEGCELALNEYRGRQNHADAMPHRHVRQRHTAIVPKRMLGRSRE
jgi:hypothetical protein